MDAEDFLPRLEVEELLRRYAAGERRFINVDLSGADLSGLDFGERRGKGVIYNKRIVFSESNLCGVNLREANLFGAMFDCTNLTDAILENAILENAILELSLIHI